MSAACVPDLTCFHEERKASKSKQRRERASRRKRHLWEAAQALSGLQLPWSPFLVPAWWQPEPECFNEFGAHKPGFMDKTEVAQNVDATTRSNVAGSTHSSQNSDDTLILVGESFHSVLKELTVLDDTLKKYLYGNCSIASHFHIDGDIGCNPHDDLLLEDIIDNAVVHEDTNNEAVPEMTYLATAQRRIATLLDLHRRQSLSAQDLQQTVDSDDRSERIMVEPTSDDALHDAPRLCSSMAIAKYVGLAPSHTKHSSWDLSLDRLDSLAVGAPVLADVAFGGVVPEKSRGIVMELLESHLAQVVFESYDDQSLHCINVPIERLCVPAADEHSSSDDCRSDRET